MTPKLWILAIFGALSLIFLAIALISDIWFAENNEHTITYRIRTATRNHPLLPAIIGLIIGLVIGTIFGHLFWTPIEF